MTENDTPCEDTREDFGLSFQLPSTAYCCRVVFNVSLRSVQQDCSGFGGHGSAPGGALSSPKGRGTAGSTESQDPGMSQQAVPEGRAGTTQPAVPEVVPLTSTVCTLEVSASSPPPACWISWYEVWYFGIRLRCTPLRATLPCASFLPHRLSSVCRWGLLLLHAPVSRVTFLFPQGQRRARLGQVVLVPWNGRPGQIRVL